jgi:hypothetical protein
MNESPFTSPPLEIALRFYFLESLGNDLSGRLPHLLSNISLSFIVGKLLTLLRYSYLLDLEI